MKIHCRFVALLVILATPCLAAEKFTHPGYAFSITPPEGFAVKPFVDELNTPYYVFTPDAAADNPANIARGQWIYAVPIPTDDQLDPNTLMPMISALIVAREPGLKISETRTPAKLGGLDALVMSVEGKRAVAGAWKGELIIAVQEDNYILVSQGGPPEEFAQLKPRFDAALKTLVAPLTFKAFSEPAAGARLPSEAEVKDLLKRCTPLVRTLARKNVKDEETLGGEIWTGTGFLIHPDGWVITNRHVAESGVDAEKGLTRLCYDPVELLFDKSLNIKPVMADVVAVSYQWDLSLLKIRGNQKWPAVPLADPARVRKDHKLLVAGWPKPQQFGRENVTIAPGKVLITETDSRGRHVDLLHDAFTLGGSSGGPVFDMDLGAIVATHYAATIPQSTGGAAAEFVLPEDYKFAVPVSRLLWEFPHVASNWKDNCKGFADRRSLVAYLLMQQRFGPAFMEMKQALKEKPDDGMVNAYAYRMYAMQRDTERAQDHLKMARKKPESSFPVVLFAAQTSLENEDIIESHQWCQQAFAAGGPTNPIAMQQLVKAQVAGGGQAEQFIHMTQAGFGALPNPELEALKGIHGITKYIDTYNVHRLPPRNPAPQQMIVDATVALEKSIELWPARNGISWAHLAMIHAVDGRKKKMEECRTKALLVSPSDPFVRLTIAHVDLMYGDLKRADQQLKAAFQMRSTKYGVFLRGWWLLLGAQNLARGGDMPKAREWLAKGRALIDYSTQGEARQLWWRSYSANIVTNIR